MPWQTDASIGDWFYRKPDTYPSATHFIHVLADIVSKNGKMLLNIPPRPDGTLDPRAVKTLKAIGAWLRVNGEAIYGTHPWKQAVEDHARFTSKGDVLHVILLKRPGRKVELRFPGSGALGERIENVIDVSSGKAVMHEQLQDHLVIHTPMLAIIKTRYRTTRSHEAIKH
ncbi:MAG: hypothetical protein GYA24_24805 [Candidatus Lokiarchaeota archaeon]|nr:hypothetical protein [Candidatus Lokiarchaeota archaeon]